MTNLPPAQELSEAKREAILGQFPKLFWQPAERGSTVELRIRAHDTGNGEVIAKGLTLENAKALIAALTELQHSRAAEAVDGPSLLEEARQEIVLAIAFLGRDVGTERLLSTAEGLITRLVAIDAKIRAASPASPSATGVRVKKLEWRKPTDHPKDPDADDNIACADGLGGVYAVSRKQKVGPAYLLWWAHDPMDWSGFDTVDAAKAAAQTDYEARILSALVEQT